MVASEIARLSIARSRRVVFVVHRIELVQQAHARLAAFGIEAGVIKAGFAPKPHLPVQVACLPTMIRRAMPQANLVILDECHHGVSDSWARVVKHYRDAGAWILGITATPLRLDGKPLGAAFDTIVEPVTTAELVRDGFLIAPTVYAPPVDLKGLPKRGGDYSIPELAERVSPLTGDVVKTWLKHAGPGVRTVAFAVNIKHSLLIEEAFRAAGARVAHIDGKSQPRDRHRVNQALRAGNLDVVTQCALWTEGVDIPELECIVVARPTKSLSLHRQMIGRVMRPAPGKARALVLDHAGNFNEHGSILDDVEWSLTGPVRRPRTAAPTRTCPECFAVYPASAEECPACGAVAARREQGTPGVGGDGELVLADTPQRAPMFGADVDLKRAKYIEWLQEATAKRRKIGWAQHRYHDAFGVWPNWSGKQAIERAHYRCFTPEHHDDALTWTEIQTCPTCRRKEKWAPGGIVKGAAWSPHA